MLASVRVANDLDHVTARWPARSLPVPVVSHHRLLAQELTPVGCPGRDPVPRTPNDSSACSRLNEAERDPLP
jgi:hypothetical protein